MTFHGVPAARCNRIRRGRTPVKATHDGFSISYDVEDEAGVEWSVKIGDRRRVR